MGRTVHESGGPAIIFRFFLCKYAFIMYDNERGKFREHGVKNESIGEL